MKIVNSFIKRIEIIAFILGFVAGIYMLIFFPARYLVAWHALPTAPETTVKIISVNMSDVIVQTISNKKFKCNLRNEKECWTEVDYEPLELGKTLCSMEDCSNDHTVQMIRATRLAHSFGEISNIYSLHDDGIIYVRQTGFVYLEGYMMGAILGGFCAFIAFIGKYLFLGVISLFQKSQTE